MKGEKTITIIIKQDNYQKYRYMKKIIQTKDAPRALGPYSQAVEINNTLYIAGQVALDPRTGEMVEGGIAEQTTQVMKNIGAILNAAGYSFEDVLSSTCLLADMSDFKAMNEIYARYYQERQPARAAFAVKELPLGAMVEIVTVAAK